MTEQSADSTVIRRVYGERFAAAFSAMRTRKGGVLLRKDADFELVMPTLLVACPPGTGTDERCTYLASAAAIASECDTILQFVYVGDVSATSDINECRSRVETHLLGTTLSTEYSSAIDPTSLLCHLCNQPFFEEARQTRAFDEEATIIRRCGCR